MFLRTAAWEIKLICISKEDGATFQENLLNTTFYFAITVNNTPLKINQQRKHSHVIHDEESKSIPIRQAGIFIICWSHGNLIFFSLNGEFKIFFLELWIQKFRKIPAYKCATKFSLLIFALINSIYWGIASSGWLHRARHKISLNIIGNLRAQKNEGSTQLFINVENLKRVSNREGLK